MIMGYALPSGVVNTDSVYFYADTSFKFGPYVKEPTDQTLVVIDYSQITPPLTLVGYQFSVDVSTNPQLIVSYPQVDPTGTALTFLLSGGISGQQYNISIRLTTRTDVLTISIPSSGDCACDTINPVPSIYNQLPLNGQGYVNTGVRYFYGVAPPANPNVLDQWFTPTTSTLSEWATDGTKFFWQTISSDLLVTEAPIGNIIYGRYNGFWVPEPIQVDAPADGGLYARFMNGWAAVPATSVPEAPNDGQLYGRESRTWVVIPEPTVPEAPNNGTLYGRINQTWQAAYPAGNPAGYQTAGQVTAQLANYYLASNPANYQTAAQITAALIPFMTVNGSKPFTGAVQFNAGLLLPNGPATLSITGGTAGQILISNGSTFVWGSQSGGIPEAPTDGQLYGRENSAWTVVPAAASVTVAATAPASPTAGALWWDSTGGQMYIWYNDGNSSQWVPVVNEVGAYLSMAGGTVTGPIDLKNQAVTQSGAALSINRAVAENVSVTLTGNITSIAVTGWPIAGTTGKMRLIVNNTGAFTVAGWPTGTIWPGGTAPVITSGAGKKDIVLLMSDDGGVTIFGSIVGQDYH